MELYLSACSKTANVAAKKAASSSVAEESQQCGDLFRPSYGFNLNDPYCRLLETQYKSLHDPHLRTYYKRKDILRRLKKGGYITSNNKWREKGREIREVQVLRILVLKPYLDMISKELEQLERTAEEQRLLRMDREERRQREYARKKLSLRRKIEEEWKTKEMLLLTKIGEDVKREQRVEEQRRRSREESDRKITSEELNSIIQNIMTWVVATVTSILYPAITKYEERVQSNTYPVSDDSDLSSDSSSFCSTCSEGFTYRSYTPKTYQADPCIFAGETPVKKPPTPLKPPSAHVERTVIEKTYHMSEESISSQVNYNETSLEYPFPKIGSSKSDSHLMTSLETSTKISKDATTETDTLEIPLVFDQRAKALDQMKNLKNVFVNFKCHLKGETQLILESIFQEIMSDLSQAIPSLSSVTAEVFVDQCDTEREEMLSNVDICSVASEIVENMLEKLESAVEKQCVQMFSQEDLAVELKPSLSTSGDYLSSLDTKPSEDTLSYTLEPMCDIADDMVHAILEKLMTLASYKKSELPPEDTTNHFQQQINTEPTHKLQKKPDQKRSSPESDAANLIMKEEMQNLISSIFSQSSLVCHVEEAISTILGYVQTELNNERLIASEETVVLLQLLDDVLTQLHPEPAKASVKKHRQPRVRNLPDTEEKYRVTGSRSFNGPRTKRPFPPVNVPGMVLYSEDDDEEIDNLVKSVLDSSFSGEKTKPQEQITNHSATKRDTCFERKRSNKQPTETSQSKAGHHDWGLGLKLSLSGEDIVKTKHCLTNDASIFSQDQKHEIQKASENIVKHILTEMFKDMSSDSSHYSGNKIGEETSDFILEKSQGLQNQEWMEQMFSRSEICAFAHEITDSVINILHKASKYIPHTIKNAISSVHQSCLEHSDTPQTAKEIPTKTPFKVWFDSEKKMKYLSSLNVELEKTSQLRSGECEPKRVNDITDKIINTIFKSLTLFVCPKLQRGNKPSQIEKSLHSQLSTYTMKIVNIVLHAIQNELGLNNINPNTRDTDHIKCHASKGLFADPNEAVDSHICSVDEFMESPLLTCICEMISCTNEDQTNTSTSTDKTLSTLCGSDNVNKQNILSSKQDKTSFRKFMATPCIRHSTLNRKDLKDSPKLKVLDQIGETLHEMLSKLPEAHHDSQPSSSQQNTEKSHKDPLALSNVQLISKTILDYVLAKLCDIDQDKSIVNSELKTASESLDIDNLSFASIMEEMAKCTYMISNTISKMVMGKKEIPKNEAKNDLPVSSKTENSEEMCPDKLKAVASDILNVVFAKLELFAGGNEENVSVLNDENKKETMMDCECESRNSTDSHDKSLQSTLYNHAKKVSSAILKAIQTELNIDPSDCKENIKSSTQETQIFTKIVDLILDVVSSDMFTEPESENRGTENYGYRPIYGNFLPGGAEPESFLDSDDKQNKEFIGDRTSPREETSTFSTDQWILERTLNKIEVKLKEPHKSPIVPIIRNILNEIFQSALINQLNVVSLSHSHFTGRPHNIPVSTIQTSAQFRDPLMGPLVSDTDVTVVVNDVVRTVFHKLFSAAMTEKPVSENRCETIIFSTNVSFREHTYTGNRPVTMLSGNPCDIQSSWNVDKQTKINVVEDIVQAILQNLENFAASKVESLFHPQINFRVPVTLPVQQQEGSLSTALSGNDSYSDKQFPCSSVEHGTPGKMDSWCQLSLSRLNIYAKEVARKILQGIKYELDKEQESPLLTNNVVVSENIASQIVNTVLDIVSCKSKCDKNSSDQDNYSDQQDGIIERLVNKADYRKILEFQIQDTIEGILCDIYENIIHQNNLSFATPTLQYSIPGTHSEVNIQPVVRGTNIIPKVSVPKTDVILVSKDIVNIVLRSLTSLVMLAINAKDPASTRLAFCDMFPKSQCQQSLFITQRTEEKPGHFSHSEDKSLAYADVYQMPMKRKEDTRELTQDPCEENANFITETIFNRLQSFATERINSLISPALQSNKENVFISPKFENGKHDDSIFHEPGQVESGVNVLRLPTTEADPSHELVEPVFSSCGESLETTIHLSQTTLKDYADFIASAILKLIKNDLDLETQSMHTYSNSILFQKNIIVSEIVTSILRILHNKGSVKEFFLPSPENPSCSQLTIPNEVLLGFKEKENTGTLSNPPLEESQMILEKESQRVMLEEIFMRKGESKPKENSKVFSAVEEVLKKLSQNIMEIIGHLPPFNEIPYVVSKSKSKMSVITQKKLFQSHINNVSNDILENILGEMHSVIVTSLYKKTKSRREVEMHDNNDTSAKPPCFKETKLTRKISNTPRFGGPEMHPYADNLNALVLENMFFPYSPLQIGRYLVQIVLDKLSSFVSLHLEERFPFEGSYDDMYLLRLHNSKLSPKNSPRPGCKTSLKARSKVTSLSKFKTKPHLGISGTKSKSKTKLGAVEKTPRENRSQTAIGLPQTPSTEDAKVVLKTKLPTSELRVYAKNIITDILEIIMKELEKVVQNRTVLNTKTLPSGQILEASKIVNAVLQELYATNNHNMASPINVSNLGDHRLSKQNLGAGSPTEQQACFYLENVSSQLEQIFPKEGIFKKMFDKWQTETSDTENEKSKLLTIAENILTEISIKAKDLEYSLSLLNLPPLEDCENRFYDRFKCGATRAEDTKAQINMFGREIVEMLFEKLQLCFLSQMPTQDSKGILTSRKEHVAAKSKHGVPNKHILSGVQTCNKKMKDQVSISPSNQIVQEIVERVLNMLESFVDLKFKHISKYEFSEIVKMPIDNLFQVQQRQLSKKMLPKLQPFRKFGEEPKSSTIISKENVHNTLLQVHSFHSELLTYSVTTVSDMLSIIKNKLDKEISQMEPFPVSTLKENIAASEIIGTLIDQCTNFNESLITNLHNKNWFEGTENVYIVNQVEFASHMKMPASKMRNTSMRSNSPQRSVSGLGLNSEDDTKQKYEITSSSSSHVSSCVENKIKSSDPTGSYNSNAVPLCSRNKAQDQSQTNPNFGLFEGSTSSNNSLPEGSVLQKLFKKANDSTEESLKQAMSFIEMGKGENPRVFHYETTKPTEPNEIKTTASPLKICLAADNIVNTVLSSYGFPQQPHPDESLETVKPFLMSSQNSLSSVCEGQKNENNLLKMWYKRMDCMNEEESEGLEACQGDFSLLHKWENKNSKLTSETLEETDKITFVDHELGPNEMHLVARHVTTSVITYLKHFKDAGEIVTRVLSKIFSPKPNTNAELENMTQKIVNSVNNRLNRAKIPILCDKQSSFPFGDADIVDELVTSVYRNVLKQHGLDPDIEESENSDAFVENIAKLIIAAISDYLLHPLFSGDLSAASCSNSMADNIVFNVLDDVNNSSKPNQYLPPYNTLLPYTFLEDMIRVLLSKFFPLPKVASNTALKDKGVNFNEIASNLISDIRRKISQHEIRFSKDEDKAKSCYSEDDVRHLVDSVFTNILENSDSQESVEENITKSNDVLIDKIAGFIIKYVCEHHLQPFVEKRQLASSTCECFDDTQNFIYASAYSSTFLEDVVSGVVSKIFHRVVGIVQVESTRNSEDVLFDKAESLIYWITEEFSKAQVTTIENAEERLCFPPVEKDVLKNMIGTVYGKVLEEYEMEMMPDKDFLDDTKALAGQITKIILTEIFDFQIPPDLIENLPLSLHSKLSQNALVNRVHYDISKSRFRRQASTIYTTMLSHIHLEKIVTQLISQISPSHSSGEHSDTSQSDLSNTVMKLINEIMSIISKHAICIVKHGNEKQSMISEKDMQSMVDSIYADLSHSNLYQSLTKDKKGVSSIPVSKIASFIIKEIFNHHLESFLSGDKSFLSASVAQPCKKKATNPKQRELSASFVQPCKKKATNPKQRELSFIMNSAVFLEEVISDLLCRILQTFLQNSLADETPEKAIAKIMDIVTALVKSIVLEFTTSEILLAENLDESLWFSETYKEMVQKTVNSVYENILDQYKSLMQLHRAVQNDTTCFGGKIYHFLLEEIYDYQVQSLVSGELMPSSYSFPRAENIIKNVLNVILKDTNALPSCITVLPCSLIENMIYKLLVNIFPTDDTTSKLKEKEVGPDDDDEFMAAASKLTDEIIKEISEHEIRFAAEEENVESVQQGTTENFIDSVCNNILKNSEFQAEVQKDAHKKGSSFLSKMAGFIMKEIMNHHLRPFLYGEDSPSGNLPDYGRASVLAKSGKEKSQPSLFSAAFLEDVIVDLAHKFSSFATLTEDSRKKDMPEPEVESLALNFANSLVQEFRKSEIKVLPHAEEIFSFPPIGKETVNEISNSVYDQFIGKFGSDSIQKDNTGNIVIEMVSSLAQKAISSFKIQPLFSGDWCSTFFSFLDPENITQRVQLLPQKTSMQISRCLKQSQLALSKDTSMKKDDVQCPILNSIATLMKSNIINLMSGSTTGITDTKKDDENKLKSAPQKYENASKVMSPTISVKSKGTQVQHLSDKCKSNETEKENLVLINEQGQMIEIYTHFAVATVENSSEKEELVSDLVIDNESKMDNASKSIVKTDEKPKSKRKESIKEKTVKIAQQPVTEERTQSVSETDRYEEPYSETERVENVIENIYDNILISSQEQLDFFKPTYSKGVPSDKPLVIGQDSAQPVPTKGLSPSVNTDTTAKEKVIEETETKRKEKSEIKKEKDIKSLPSKPDHPQSSSESKPTIIPAMFLEDVLTELVNKLIFTPSPEPKKYDSTPKASEDQNQDELYDTAMKLIDSMLKQFSDAEVKVFRPEKGNEIFTKATKESEVHPVPPVLKATKDSEVHPVPPVLKVTKESVVHHPVPPVLKVTKESEVHPVLPVLKATKESEVHPVPPVLKATKDSEVHPVPPVLKATKESEVHPVPPVLKVTKESEVHPVLPVLKATKESEVHPVPPVLKVTKESEVHPVLPVLKATKLSEVHPVLPVLKATKLSEVHPVLPVLKATKLSEVHPVLPVLKATKLSEVHPVLPVLKATKLSEIHRVPPVLKATKESEVHTVPPVLKEAVTGEPASSMTIENVDKLPPTQKATEQPSFHKIPSLHRMPSIEKSVVNKIVHSCVCNVLKECTSQESVCKNINSNGENLAKRLTSTVISEIFQHQLNLMFSDEIPASACVPLESKDVEKKVQKAVETASKECQTSSPYTIKLPFKFLDDVISALLAKVFSKLSNVKTKISQQTPLTQLDFLQMKLVNTVAAEIAKNEDMIIQYVESLHPNDDEIIQLVVQTIYNNLLPQFGTQETIQNCIASGCRLLSKTIVDLVLREVAGNQLQNYFGGELTPYQCAEVDNVVENILTNVALTTSPQPPHPRKLSYHVIEAISVKFLSKLLSVFPTVHTVKTKSPETEMQKISSKILKSIQECMSKSKIKVVKPAKELEPEPLADDATIEKVANSVYANLLKHSGSPASVFEDLMGKNNVLPDIIGSLMVKEISNSEFQAQAEEELSSSEIALEAVKIMEKVVKIIDELKSKEKSSSIKDLILDSRVLEEALALFLAKLVKKPGPESKDTDNLTKPELNKIASQLTKSVTAEISRSNISLVDSDPEEQPLDPENIEKISQVIDSVYSNIIKQSGDDNELYDMKGTKKLFPKKVASLIVNGVSNVPSCRVITKSSDAGVFGDLDTNRIIEKAQKHAARMNSDSDKELDDVVEDELPVRIIPHIGNKPLKIDPNIIAEHLAVISMKTQPLETLKMDCLKRTGYSIAELRRASISGKGHSSTEVCEMGTRQKERRISLDRTGRLDVKPLEAVGRNSFQNVRRPDITRVELLKDIHNKKDLIVRLVAHDISKNDLEGSFREDMVSDEEEIVLGEVAGHQCLGEISGDHVGEVLKPSETQVVSPKTTTSTSSLRKFLALSKCCHPTSGEHIESIEATGNQTMEPSKTHVKRAVAELDMPSSKILAEGPSSSDKLQYKLPVPYPHAPN
ncbi:Fibrous sheath-interacting protein 2 [Cricetulus griseus]|uniref:Fibrous sheath-interacting protein 2 n=1 Tax=Cricetulus griseus TaxID=10029 RepID=G3HHS1_CRIGR|nr:Fibrous sheath-interacting protein 2 [Cricetulus griseus]